MLDAHLPQFNPTPLWLILPSRTYCCFSQNQPVLLISSFLFPFFAMCWDMGCTKEACPPSLPSQANNFNSLMRWGVQKQPLQPLRLGQLNLYVLHCPSLRMFLYLLCIENCMHYHSIYLWIYIKYKSTAWDRIIEHTKNLNPEIRGKKAEIPSQGLLTSCQ